MALEYVGGKVLRQAASSGNYDVSLTDLTGGLASAPAAGDLVLVMTGFGTPSVETPPAVNTSGYTNLFSLFADDNHNSYLSGNWKIMGGTPDTVVNVKGCTAGVEGTVVHVWRGANPTTPIDVTSVTAERTGTGYIDAPTITPVTTGAVTIVTGVVASADDFTYNQSAGTPTPVYGNIVQGSLDGGTSGAFLIASAVWAGGAVPAINFVSGTSSSADSSCSAHIAIRPAASGPANLKTWNTNPKSNIKTINTNPIANVKSLDTNV